jgi:hypothetical protein
MVEHILNDRERRGHRVIKNGSKLCVAPEDVSGVVVGGYLAQDK